MHGTLFDFLFKNLYLLALCFIILYICEVREYRDTRYKSLIHWKFPFADYSLSQISVMTNSIIKNH